MRALCLSLALRLLTALPLSAAICQIDQLGAATLLLPYFEVDPSDPGGVTTLLAVDNTTQFEVVAKAEVWSDLGVPVGGFNIFLAPHAVQTINMRDVLDCKLPS